MIGYVMVGTNNLDKAIIFYDEVLQILNLQRKDTDEICAGYCQKGGDGSIEFYVTKPVNKKEATIFSSPLCSEDANTYSLSTNLFSYFLSFSAQVEYFMLSIVKIFFSGIPSS